MELQNCFWKVGLGPDPCVVASIAETEKNALILVNPGTEKMAQGEHAQWLFH